MIYSNTPNPPAKFTASMYGKTVTIELDHSDFDLSELMEIFKGLAIASGFEMVSWNNVIKNTASEIYDEEHEIVKEALNTDDDEDEFKDLRHSYLKDSEGYESADELENDFFGTYDAAEKRMDIIGQNGNEGTHYDYDGQFNDWKNETPIEEDEDTKLKDYKGIYINRPTFDWDNETNDILTNINDSITLIKDRMEDIDMRMDNIDEQISVLNADVANIEYSIENPIKQTLIDGANRYNAFNDVVDMDNGEVSNDMDNGGFDNNKFKTPKVLGKWQTDNKTKKVVTLDKTKVRKGKIKDLKK